MFGIKTLKKENKLLLESIEVFKAELEAYKVQVEALTTKNLEYGETIKALEDKNRENIVLLENFEENINEYSNSNSIHKHELEEAKKAEIDLIKQTKETLVEELLESLKESVLIEESTDFNVLNIKASLKIYENG